MSHLLKLLNLRRNEVPRLGLAAAVFFLVQVDDGIVKSVAAAVFNIRAGVDKLPLMYSWIAVLFSLSMALLSWLTAKVSRQVLLFGLMAAVGLVLFFNAGMLLLEHLGRFDLQLGFYSFLFISSELARTLANFQVWIVAGGICYTARAKVLFPLLAASAVLGDIAGGFGVRLLGALLESYQLYGLAALNMVLVVFLLRNLVRRYFVVQQEGGAEEVATLGENLRYFGRSPYLQLLFALSLAIFALYTALHYGFNVVGRQHYPSEEGITGLFGLFYALTGLATLLATTFLLQRLLRWVGTGNVYLWVSATYALVALAMAGVFAEIAGVPPVGAMFAGNLFNFLLLDSIVAPTYQVLIKLVPGRHSDGTRMIMEGGFMLLGGLAGAGVTALHARGVLSLGELFMGLFALGALMAGCGFLLKRSYTAVLVRAVREQAIDLEDDQAMQSLRQLLSTSAGFSRSLLLHRDDGVRQMGIEMLRQNPGPAVEQVCLELVRHENPRIRSAALEALNPGNSADRTVSGVLACLDDEDQEVRLSAVHSLGRLLGVMELNQERRAEVSATITALLHADGGRAALQAECLVILEKLQHQASAQERRRKLQALLDSQAVEEIIAGIQVAGRIRAVEVDDRLLGYLGHAHPAVREAAVHSLGALGREEGFRALLDMLADPDPDVVEAVIETLGRTADPGQRGRMVEELERRPLKEWEGLLGALIALDDETLAGALMDSCRQRLIEASRYLVAIERLHAQPETPALGMLIDQLRGQNLLVQNGVVRLLGYLGDVGVVGDLLERLSAEDEEARQNAIELLENIADRELLTLLLPLLESDAEEQGRLALQTSGWEGASLDEVLRHLLRAADAWTQMAAAWAAAALERVKLVDEVRQVLAPQARETLREIEAKRGESEMADEELPLTTMEKITFLKESPFFAALPLEELYHIALSMEEESVKGGTTVIKEGTRGDKMYIVVRGQLEVKKEGRRFAVLGEKQVFGEQALLDDEPRSASVVALEEAHLLSLQRTSLERLLRRYSSIAFNMMRTLSQRLRASMAGAG